MCLIVSELEASTMRRPRPEVGFSAAEQENCCLFFRTSLDVILYFFARMGESREEYRDLGGNLRKRDHLEDPGVNGRVILRWNFRKCDVGEWNGSIWLRIETTSGHL